MGAETKEEVETARDAKVVTPKSSKKAKKDKSSSKKEPKSSTKKKKKKNENQDDNDIKNEEDISPPKPQDERKRKRDEKKQAKEEIMAKVPLRDNDGISYTKQQIRKMMKRVKRGLPPIPTAEEEAELKRQDAQLRKEEEMELAGMLYQREQKEEEEDADSDKESDNDVEDEAEDDGDGDEENNNTSKEAEPTKLEKHDSNPNKKRKTRSKPVPPDYVCMACQNKHKEPHWIYDCPDKKTVRGTNRVSTKGNQPPSAKKVFVSGLPFDSKGKDVRDLFKTCGKVTSLKLLTFPDTGRCKGQAFVAFETEEAAQKALQMNGTEMGDAGDQGGSKVLELRVSKTLNRAITTASKQKR